MRAASRQHGHCAALHAKFAFKEKARFIKMRDKVKISGSPAYLGGKARIPAPCLLNHNDSFCLLWLYIEINLILFVISGEKVAL